LTDAEGTILALGRLAEKGRRILRVGGPDAPPPPVKPSIARAAAPRFPAPDGALSLSAAVERLFDELDARDELDAARAALTAEIEAGVRIRRARIEGLRARLELARGADDLQHRADLLSAARGRVPRGAAEVRLVDYFDPAMPEITVPLDPAVPFETHVERLYARLRRLRSGVEKTRAELGRAESELAILTDARVEAGACQDLDCCAALRARLERARHLTPRRKPAPARPAPAEPFRRFRSRDGLEILVGKGARENEALTFAHARGNDLWLHAGGGVAGSHVVVRLARGASAPLETLLDAAALAVHFSKARGAGRADVVYTLRKFVAKPRGARSGSVAITGETHLSIDLDRARLDRLLSAHRPEIEDSPEPPCPPDG
jgi:predicted ribosome quality control (RQC) complex YloA/Tae2 family protein